MGVTFKATTKGSHTPEVDEGEYIGRFEGVEEKVLEKSQFDPEAFIWNFTLLDGAGKVIYYDGDPVEVEKVTSRNTNVKSKTVPGAVQVLKSLMTKAEFEAFADEEQESELTEDELKGRLVMLDIFHKESGYLGIEDVRRYGKGGLKKVAKSEE